jgi:antagonist of KipI
MSLKIIKAGMLDTVQDLGRYGYQHLGINPGGAMDRFSVSLVNALLGKELDAPVIELHFPASTILFAKPSVICLTGADFTPVINDVSVPLCQPLLVNASSVLKFNAVKKGTRCYLALLNELKIKKWLGSYSTNLKAAAGGFNGRKLVKDDELNFVPLNKLPTANKPFIPLPWRYSETSVASSDVEFIPGNEWNWIDTKSQTVFLNESFVITPASDRMGYRLQGHSLAQAKTENLVSSAACFGTIQLLPNGQLIVLMADHQTTGGYPRIGHVISAHLPKLAQQKPGDELKFIMTTVEEAEEKMVRQQESLTQLQNTCNLKMQNFLHAHRP